MRYPTVLYLWVSKAADVRVQVEFDAFTSPWQGQSTDQQHQKHGKREGSGEVDNLLGEKASGVSVPAAGTCGPLFSQRQVVALGAGRTLETHWSHLPCHL